MATLTTSFNIIVNQIPSFDNRSWIQLGEMLRAHDNGELNIYDFIHVGDTKDSEIAAISATGVNESHAAQMVTFVIRDTNVVDLSGGGKCHFVVQQLDVFYNGDYYHPDTYENNERGYINSTRTNVGGWKESARRSWCNNEYFNSLPAGLRSIIKPASIKTSSGNKQTTMDTTIDKCFFPCEYNVFGSATYAVAGEDTIQWESFRTANNRKIYPNRHTYKKQSITPTRTWLRSPAKDWNNNWCLIDTNGTTNTSNPDLSYGIAPCFCI